MENNNKTGLLEKLDTIVVPAHPEGFQDVFLGQSRWPNLKVDRKRFGSLKYVAIYQTRPISAITHYAEIASFKPLERPGRFDVSFTGNPHELRPVRFTSADVCAIQGPRYTNLKLIKKASSLSAAFPKFEFRGAHE